MYHSTYTGAKTVTFVPITDSLHFVMLDQPAQFNAALDAFLTQ
jgi:pimeloyl-ACP methyl ester carboxylesterase